MFPEMFPNTGTASVVPPTRLVTLLFGANDSADAALNPSQHVPVDEYGENIRWLVRSLRKTYPNAVVVVISPPPIHESKWADRMAGFGKALDRSNELAGIYANRALSVAEQEGCPSVDCYGLMGGRLGSQDKVGAYLHDGLHLSAEGSIVLFESLCRLIEERFGGDLGTDSVPFDAP